MDRPTPRSTPPRHRRAVVSAVAAALAVAAATAACSGDDDTSPSASPTASTTGSSTASTATTTVASSAAPTTTVAPRPFSIRRDWEIFWTFSSRNRENRKGTMDVFIGPVFRRGAAPELPIGPVRCARRGDAVLPFRLVSELDGRGRYSIALSQGVFGGPRVRDFPLVLELGGHECLATSDPNPLTTPARREFRGRARQITTGYLVVRNYFADDGSTVGRAGAIVAATLQIDGTTTNNNFVVQGTSTIGYRDPGTGARSTGIRLIAS